MRKGIMVLILILLASSIDVFAILTQEGDIIVSLSSKSDQNTFKSKSMIFRQNPDGTWYSPSHPDVRRNLNTNEVIWWGTTGGRSYMKVERLSEEPTPVIVESTQTLQQKSTTSQPPAAEAPKPEEKTAHTYPEVKKEAEKAPETKPAAPAPAAKPLETDLQKIVSDKIGTEQAVAAAKAKYEAEKKAYDAADAKHKAALDAYNANPNKETETAWHNALIELADASMKKDEAAIQLQDEQIALAQKQEEIKSFTQPERAAAIKKAKEKQERQKELLAEKESLDRDIKNTENIIDATEDRIDEIEDEEGKKAEKEYLEEYLKEQKEKLKELKKKSETNKADIEKQKPIAGAASADVRLNEIDNEIFALNRDVTVSNEEYKIRQQEREKAEKAQRLTEEQYGEYYKKALAVPEAQRTDEQKEIISSYEQWMKADKENIENAKKQEAKAKAAYEAKQKEAKEKTRDLEKERAEVQDVKKKFELKSNIALNEQTITKLRAELAKIEDKDERRKKEKEIEKLERENEKMKNEIFLRENNWVARWAFIFMTDFMQGYEEYKGIGKWSALWITDEDMAKKRQEAAQKFCDNILGGVFGGKNCYQSKICDARYPREPAPTQNFLVTEIGVGGYTPAASIQAEKSFPILYMEGGKAKTKRVYKITYFIENPHMDQELTYHIELRGTKTFKSQESKLAGRTLEKMGGKEGRLGSDPLIFESDSNYENACLVFSPRIKKSNGGYTSEICAPIIQYSGAATKPYTFTPEMQAALQNTTGTRTGVSMTGA